MHALQCRSGVPSRSRHMNGPVIHVWVSAGGTTAECDCGWRVHTSVGVGLHSVMSAAESHEESSGHRWPTEEESGD